MRSQWHAITFRYRCLTRAASEATESRVEVTQNNDICDHAAEWACLSVVLSRQRALSIKLPEKAKAPMAKAKELEKERKRPQRVSLNAHFSGLALPSGNFRMYRPLLIVSRSHLESCSRLAGCSATLCLCLVYCAPALRLLTNYRR